MAEFRIKAGEKRKEGDVWESMEKGMAWGRQSRASLAWEQPASYGFSHQLALDL